MNKETIRCGVVACPIWGEVTDIDGEYLILVHYRRCRNDIEVAAAFTRYNGQLTDISDRFRNLKLTPDWRARLPRKEMLD